MSTQFLRVHKPEQPGLYKSGHRLVPINLNALTGIDLFPVNLNLILSNNFANTAPVMFLIIIIIVYP